MNMVDIILEKESGRSAQRGGNSLFRAGRGGGNEFPDYQLSALLMAICLWRGMNAQETTCLTMEMMHSGGVVDLSGHRRRLRG